MDKQKFWREVRGWTYTIVGVLAFRAFLYEAVYIPSGSMLPTLQIGDYVIVEKWAYGARIPLTSSAQLTWSTPKRGDIVVLLSPPGNPTTDDLIKRVVAVGGDTVEISDGHLVVNGKPVPRRRLDGACHLVVPLELDGSHLSRGLTEAMPLLPTHPLRGFSRDRRALTGQQGVEHHGDRLSARAVGRGDPDTHRT